MVPLQQEGVITANAMVNGAVMFGRGRSQCGVLIEPKPDYAIDPNNEQELIDFRNTIWSVSVSRCPKLDLCLGYFRCRPVVEEANNTAPKFAKVFKEMIIVTRRDKPLPRAAKGTIVRGQALAAYEEEIKAL